MENTEETKQSENVGNILESVGVSTLAAVEFHLFGIRSSLGLGSIQCRVLDTRLLTGLRDKNLLPSVEDKHGEERETDDRESGRKGDGSHSGVALWNAGRKCLEEESGFLL